MPVMLYTQLHVCSHRPAFSSISVSGPAHTKKVSENPSVVIQTSKDAVMYSTISEAVSNVSLVLCSGLQSCGMWWQSRASL